jgi:hypothetical protein
MRERATPTAGPWEWGAHPSEDIAQVYAPEQPEYARTIADVYEIADAHLIAAAPDLLAACEALMDTILTYHEDAEAGVYDRYGVDIPKAEIHALSAAIAKARGEIPA